MPKRCIRRSSAWSKNSLIASFGLPHSSRSGAFQSVRESSSSGSGWIPSCFAPGSSNGLGPFCTQTPAWLYSFSK
eukprot:6193355-Pyramimonas_sp.AAC.1